MTNIIFPKLRTTKTYHIDTHTHTEIYGHFIVKSGEINEWTTNNKIVYSSNSATVHYDLSARMIC